MSDAVLFEGHRILVTHRSGAVRLKLSIRPGQDHFNLSVPVGVRDSEVRRFLRANDGWMREQEQKAAGRWEPRMAAGERALVNGIMVTLGSGGIPTGEAFLTYRDRILEARVKAILPGWTRKMNVTITRVSLKSMTSRWGSCTPATGHVSLSSRLGAMPDALIEYVIVHELCHMHHPDHSPAFHA